MHVCKQISLDTKDTNAMMVLESAYCKLDAAKAKYAKLAKTTRKNTKEQKEKDENLALMSKSRQRNQRKRVRTQLMTSASMHLP